ncbi:MAG: hypothetical protein NTW21_00925 [Verrucomicrobia bacterium]|nr:hypothetical protein [Verrucomicrobiota bacterium]
MAVLCCASISAKQPDANAFDPLKFENYKAKAEQGDARGQAMLGRCYAAGPGVARDPAAAAK